MLCLSVDSYPFGPSCDLPSFLWNGKFSSRWKDTTEIYEREFPFLISLPFDEHRTNKKNIYPIRSIRFTSIPNYLLFQRSIVRYLIFHKNRGSTCIFYLLLDMHTIYFKLRKGYKISGGKLILQRGGRVEFRNGKFGNHWRARCIRAR